MTTIPTWIGGPGCVRCTAAAMTEGRADAVSLPQIRSGRTGGGDRRESASEESGRRHELHVIPEHLCLTTDVFALRCNSSCTTATRYEVLLSEDHDMIDAFPSDRADQPFGIGILPWRPRRSWLIANTHGAQASGENLTIDLISIAQQISWCLVPSAGFCELAGDPLGSRVCRHAHP